MEEVVIKTPETIIYGSVKNFIERHETITSSKGVDVNKNNNSGRGGTKPMERY